MFLLYRVSQYDIIDIRERSQKMEWFEEAQDRLGEAVPAWLQVVPESLRILVHQLPERAQITSRRRSSSSSSFTEVNCLTVRCQAWRGAVCTQESIGFLP